MQKKTIVSLLIGTVTLCVFIASLGLSVNEPIYNWIPSAFLGVAFILSFALGLPQILAYIMTVIVFLLIFFLGFFIGRLIYKAKSQ